MNKVVPYPIALLIGLVCLWLSWRCLRDVKRALNTEVADMFLQWPRLVFSKSAAPFQYYLSILLYSFGALFLFIFAVLCFLSPIINSSGFIVSK